MNVRSPAIVILICIAAGAAHASDKSERLAARGMVDFQAERYAEALPLFDQAVQADPTDMNALYYRGLTRSRLNQLTGAVADLRTIVSRQPDFVEAALDLGVALVQSGHAKEAIPYLTRAQPVPDLEAQASLFLGLANLRLGKIGLARENFQRAGRDPNLALSARYYEGVADYREGKVREAEEQFTFVTKSSPTSAVGREAAAFLQKLRGTPQTKPYFVYAEAGLQYDSNVVLAPSDENVKDSLAISNQDDGVAVFSFGGAYAPLRNRYVQIALGYDFFQSVYFTLHEFNLQDHRPSAQIAATAAGVNFGMLGSYDYYRLENDNFLQDLTALPWVTVPEGGFGRTELFYRMRRRDFFQNPFAELRDSFNHATGVRQVFFLGTPDRYAAIGYQFDTEDPIHTAGKEFAYDGNEVNAALGWKLPFEVTGEIAYGFRHEDYAKESNGRRDDEHRVSIIGEKWFTTYLGVTFGYLGTWDDSTKDEFTYDRHIVSLSVKGRY